MLMAAPRRHPYAGAGMHMMPFHQHHPAMMTSQPIGHQSQQLPPPHPQQAQPSLRQQSPPMYGGQPTMDCHSPPVSRTYQYKKVTKPLLERKRRARINRCLDELKELMVGALEAEGENVSKLEKADILELTVRHLQRITRPRDAVEDASRFQAGFTQCATEACHFLLALPGLDAHVGTRLVAHLSQMVTGLSTASAAAVASGPSSSSSSSSASPSSPLLPRNSPSAANIGTPARISPPPSPSSLSAPSSSTAPLPKSSEDGDDVDVESTEDEDDDDSPVNYTSEALRQKERKRRHGSGSSSTSSHHHHHHQQCPDDDRGPMWRPW